jgi:peptidyl-dipeptidase A
MVARTWRTFGSLGFDLDNLPVTMDLEPRAGKSQQALCVAVDPPGDVRILANSREGLLSAELLLHEMGHAVHAAHIRQAGHLLRDWPSGSFGEGIGEYFGQLVYTKEWLVSIAGAPEGAAGAYLQWRRDRRLFDIRWYLAALDFEERAYRDPDADLCALYWRMLHQYLLVPPHPEVEVWAQIPHFINLPVYLQNYLLADLMAAQLRSHFRKRFGRLLFEPRIAPLLIRTCFESGAARPGRELLKRLTGSELDPEPLAVEFRD